MTTDKKFLEFAVHLLSGGAAGAIATAFSYPFTNLRMRVIAE